MHESLDPANGVRAQENQPLEPERAALIILARVEQILPEVVIIDWLLADISPNHLLNFDDLD